MTEDASHAGAPEPAREVAAEAGWTVLHLFCRTTPGTDPDEIELAIKDCEASGHQVVSVAMLGHKSDLGLVALGPSAETLRTFQTAIARANAAPAYSYLSLTEVSEYAAGVPEELRRARLRPVLPPEGLPAFSFYPMTKRRGEADNWYRLSYEERLALMHGHGALGRTFRGRVLQLITGSTGLDDYEWGVTLFGRTHEDLKDCVYSMRFDVASARFAEFGPFLSGTVGAPDAVLRQLGLRR